MTLKSAVQEFCNLLIVLQTDSKMHVDMAMGHLENHAQHILVTCC